MKAFKIAIAIIIVYTFSISCENDSFSLDLIIGRWDKIEEYVKIENTKDNTTTEYTTSTENNWIIDRELQYIFNEDKTGISYQYKNYQWNIEKYFIWDIIDSKLYFSFDPEEELSYKILKMTDTYLIIERIRTSAILSPSTGDIIQWEKETRRFKFKRV